MSDLKTRLSSKFRIFGNYNFIFILFIAVVIIASLIKYFEGPKIMNGVLTTHYNNFLTFKYSFIHLIQNKDIYIYHPEDHWDLFKYSPAFAVFMGLYAYLPRILGLLLWNLTNVIPLLIAIKYIPKIENKFKIYLLWFIFIQLLTSVQNAQSNGLTLALLLLIYIYFEKGNPMLAALFFTLSIFLKLFGIIAIVLMLFYPQKLKFVLYSLLFTVILTLIPLLFISPEQLLFTYKSWFRLLTTDFSESTGLSVMGWLKTWFNFEPAKMWVMLAGGLIMILPLINYKQWTDRIYRLLYFASILIWVIIFNHKAESPTFVIAVCGFGIWYFSQQRTWLNLSIVIVAYILTSFSSSDIMPLFLREHVIDPFVLKAVPSILIWILLMYQLTFNKYTKRDIVIAQ